MITGAWPNPQAPADSAFAIEVARAPTRRRTGTATANMTVDHTTAGDPYGPFVADKERCGSPALTPAKVWQVLLTSWTLDYARVHGREEAHHPSTGH